MPVTSGAQHGRTTRVLVGGFSMSCQFREASVSFAMDTVDVTAFCNGLKSSIVGLPEARISMNGFLDTGRGIVTSASGAMTSSSLETANFQFLQPYFAQGTKVPFVIMPNGYSAFGLAMAGQGYITSMNLGQTVADVQSFNLEVMVDGELFVMRNMLQWNAAPVVATAGANKIIGAPIIGATVGTATDRTAGVHGFEPPYDVTTAATYSGGVYYQLYNSTTASKTVDVWTAGSALTDGTAPTASGTVVNLGTFTAASGAVAAGSIGTYASPVLVRQNTALFTTTAAANESLFPYLGLIDFSRSLVQR